MQTIEARAKLYVKGCELQGKEARKAEFDYIVGAKAERILLTEWKDASKELPSTALTVLGIVQIRDGLNLYRTISYSKHLGWLCDDVNDCDVMPSWIKVLFWRPIHECELPKYYGDDDSRAE
jgi:hypothetical protein